MLVYSKKITLFISEIKTFINKCLRNEVGVKVFGDRFYDKKEQFSYPIRIVVFNDRNMLGYFDPNFYELGFHERLIYEKKEHLDSTIRHELAHYLCFIYYGSLIQHHGQEFTNLCQGFGWGEEVSRATTCLENNPDLQIREESAILRKVKKLMALATSSNKNEAELAMVKSQELLLTHNIDSGYAESNDEEKIFLKRILKQKKKNAKLHSISQILQTFFVNTVYNRAGGFVHLEIVGSAVNIEIADYVAATLDFELDRLWECAKLKRPDLKGAIAKNSFFMGIAKGYCNKVNSLKNAYAKADTNSLMCIEKKLTEANQMVYQRLSKSRSTAHYCQESSKLGEQAGNQLSIRPGVNRSSILHPLLLS